MKRTVVSEGLVLAAPLPLTGSCCLFPVFLPLLLGLGVPDQSAGGIRRICNNFSLGSEGLDMAAAPREPLLEKAESHEASETSSLLEAGLDSRAAKRGSGSLVDLVWLVGPSFLGLGIASQCALGSYLSAGGYFVERLHAPLLLGQQALVVSLANVVVMILQELLDERADVFAGSHMTYTIRMVVTGIAGPLALLATPFCQTSGAVLAAGGVIAFCAMSQLSSVMQQASAMVPGGGGVVLLGGGLGSALPLVTAGAFQFRPGCSTRAEWLFFGAGSLVSVACTARFAPVPLVLAQSDCQLQANVEENAAESRRGVQGAYQATSEELSEDAEEPPGWCHMFCSQTPLAIFLCMATGFAIVPLFTAGTAMAAHALVLGKAGGDCLGRIMAMAHTVRVNARFCAGRFVRYGALAIILLRAALCVAVIAGFLSDSLDFSAPGMVWIVVLVFAFGNYAQLMLDTDSQLEAAGSTRRKAVQRHNLVMMFAGQLFGTGVGLLLRGGPGMVRGGARFEQL